MLANLWTSITIYKWARNFKTSYKKTICNLKLKLILQLLIILKIERNNKKDLLECIFINWMFIRIINILICIGFKIYWCMWKVQFLSSQRAHSNSMTLSHIFYSFYSKKFTFKFIFWSTFVINSILDILKIEKVSSFFMIKCSYIVNIGYTFLWSPGIFL